MTDQLSGSEATKAIADPLGTVAGWLAGFVPEGPARTLLYVVVGLCVAAAPFIYRYYLGVLAQGAALEGSLERQDYDRLRAGLAGGNLAARLYAKWLTAFLDAVERFFGDAGMADRTLFPRAFGLKKPAPLWTAPAFDRCLLLALIYPIATIFLIWAISGHVGPAEDVLGLPNNLPGWLRALIAAASVGFVGLAIWRRLRAPGWKSVALIMIIVAGAFAAAVAIADAAKVAVNGTVNVAVNDVDADRGAFDYSGFYYGYSGADFLYGLGLSELSGAVRVIAVAFAVVGAFVVAVAIPGAGAVAVAFVLPFAVALPFALARVLPGPYLDLSFAGTFTGILAVAGAFAIAVAVAGFGAAAVAAISAKATARRRQGIFLSLLLVAMIVLFVDVVELLSPEYEYWAMSGPMILFMGLLTLLNAPFDWASLGLTRALLRRGLELGGWWPYLLAFVDAALAGAIIALLALTMVVGVQAFDELAVHGGGEKAAVLPLDTLFDGIAKNPGAPEYWWAYALLLSSMIPSLVNLAIGGMAFTRGIPWLSRLLLQWMPEGKAVPEYKRQLTAIGLTGQMFAGAGLGITAQGLLAWGLVFHVMPWIGLDLLDMARAVAAFDLPARISQLFAGSLALK